MPKKLHPKGLRLEDLGAHAGLEAVQARVLHDGSAASYTMKYSGLPEFKVALSFHDLGIAMTELQSTAAAMLRQRNPYPTVHQHLEMTETAVAVVSTDVFMDPPTRDRLMVLHSEYGWEKMVRLSPFAARILLERLLFLTQIGANCLIFFLAS